MVFQVLIALCCLMPANALQSPHSGRGSHIVSGFMPGTEHRVPVAVGSQQAFRFGEADHPGPEQVQGSFAIGAMNPSGVRGKEGLMTELGQGIWCVAETQLSSVTAQSASKTVRHLAALQNRQVRTFHGAPAPLRTHSAWAGSWTGVMSIADFPSRKLNLAWPEDVVASGRVLPVFHDVAGMPITGVVFYGYPTSSSHPAACHATDSLLQGVTRDLIHGRTGPRYVAGDFNQAPRSLLEVRQWEECGWVEIQIHASMHWGWEPRPTCKGATQRDLIYVSPELAALCIGVSVENMFADHALVKAQFQGLGFYLRSSPGMRSMLLPGMRRLAPPLLLHKPPRIGIVLLQRILRPRWQITSGPAQALLFPVRVLGGLRAHSHASRPRRPHWQSLAGQGKSPWHPIWWATKCFCGLSSFVGFRVWFTL